MRSLIVEQFRHFKFQYFDGKDDPFTFKGQLRRLEEIFKHMNCNENQMVSCTKFMLIDEAGHQQESKTNTRIAKQQHNHTWNQFKKSLMRKYFSQQLKDRKEAEFLQLMQGNLPLREYERKFERLSKYALHMVNAELTKAKRFKM